MSDYGKYISSGASLFSGISGFFSAYDQADLLTDEGALAKFDYFRQAELTREEGHRIRSKQSMEFVGAGVEIIGTPQLVLKETLSRANAQAKAYETTGSRLEDLYQKKAKMAKEEGAAKLIEGVLTAAAFLI